MDPCTERWVACCNFLKTSRGKRMVRRRILNPMYPEHMIKLYINLDKWSRPRKRKVRRYMLTEDYEASLAQGSDQGPASDGEEVGALNATGEAQTPDVSSENCSRKKSEQQKEGDEEQKEQKEEQQKEDDDDEKNEDEKAIKINESSGVF